MTLSDEAELYAKAERLRDNWPNGRDFDSPEAFTAARDAHELEYRQAWEDVRSAQRRRAALDPLPHENALELAISVLRVAADGRRAMAEHGSGAPMFREELALRQIADELENGNLAL